MESLLRGTAPDDSADPESPDVPDAVDPAVLADFTAEELVVRFGDSLFWAPYRLRRWPLPSWLI